MIAGILSIIVSVVAICGLLLGIYRVSPAQRLTKYSVHLEAGYQIGGAIIIAGSLIALAIISS